MPSNRYRDADPLNEGQRENVNKIRDQIGDEAADKIGTYKESTGGGTPLAKGEKLKDHPEAKRVQQPRDEDGQFTYNSVNARELKYGPSRGKTIPPFLRIGDKEIVYARKMTVEEVRDGRVYKDEIRMTAAMFAKAFQEYIDGVGYGETVDIRTDTKKGRRKKVAQEMIDRGEEGFVPGTEKTEDWGTVQLKNFKDIYELENQMDSELDEVRRKEAEARARGKKRKNKFAKKQKGGKKGGSKPNPTPRPKANPAPKQVPAPTPTPTPTPTPKENPNPTPTVGATPKPTETPNPNNGVAPSPNVGEPKPTNESPASGQSQPQPQGQDTGKGHPDKELAKNDPEAFMRKYPKETQELRSMLNKKGIHIPIKKLVALIGDGDDDFESIKGYINSLK